MNRTVFILLALLAVSAFVPGCLGGQTPAQNETNNTAPPPPPPAKPLFTITAPASGDTITATGDTVDVTLVLAVTNLQIKPAGTRNSVGEGHFKVRVDGGSYANFFARSYTLSGISPGSHTVDVELVNNDGSSYSPAIKRSVSFEVLPYVPPVYAPESYNINIMDFSYDPPALTVKVGDSVTWHNLGASPRSATSTGNFDTKVISPGGSATIVMDKEGTFEYFSLTYMAMKGTLVVEANGTAQ